MTSAVNTISKKRKSFTLIEVLIAAGLFTVVSTLGAVIFINVLRTQRQVSLENAIYEDARFMLSRISREVRQNAIDYEEYYNKQVEGGKYGQNYGCYADRFYYPGTGLGGTPDYGDLGAYCIASTIPPCAQYTCKVQANPGCIIDKTTLDINLGKNPFIGSNFTSGKTAEEDANAFCDMNFPSPNAADCTSISNYIHNELYLIDPTGKQKTILARKVFNVTPDGILENALALIKLQGADGLNGHPADGIVDTWRMGTSPTANYFCAPGFDCPATLTSLESTLTYNVATDIYTGFVPITPLRTDVVDLKFYIAPLEDPRKAFAETQIPDAIQQQPHVTIVLTVKPAQSELQNLNNATPPQITVQTTVTSRVYNEVQSYDGVAVCNEWNA